MTNLLHELRCFTGGELGNLAADEIERMHRGGVSPETVAVWLDKIGMTAVSKADAERLNAAAGYVLMPRALTAENGAKALMIGEFKLDFYQHCPDCSEETDGCQTCGGACEVLTSIVVDWNTTRKIYAAAVAACALEQKP